jgi:hypothetical protein
MISVPADSPVQPGYNVVLAIRTGVQTRKFVIPLRAARVRLSHTHTRIPLQRLLSGTPPLGDDLDHTARRLCTVQRRRGRALDHLDRLDVVGVQHAQQVCVLLVVRVLQQLVRKFPIRAVLIRTPST